MNATLERTDLKFALEPYSEKLVQEMRPLWAQHDEEIPQLRMSLDPNLSMYTSAARAGTMRIYTARIADLIVGYQVFFVMKHPHRQYSLEANQDILWLDPELRKGFVGIKFMKWADELLRREGVMVIHRQI